MALFPGDDAALTALAPGPMEPGGVGGQHLYPSASGRLMVHTGEPMASMEAAAAAFLVAGSLAVAAAPCHDHWNPLLNRGTLARISPRTIAKESVT